VVAMLFRCYVGHGSSANQEAIFSFQEITPSNPPRPL